MRKSIMVMAALGLTSCSQLWMSFANTDPSSCYDNPDSPDVCGAGKRCDKTTFLCVDDPLTFQDMGVGNEDGGTENCIAVIEPPIIPPDRHVKIPIPQALNGMAVGDFMSQCGERQITDNRADVAVYSQSSQKLSFYYGDAKGGLVDPMIRYDLPGTQKPAFMTFVPQKTMPLLAATFIGGNALRVISYDGVLQKFDSTAATLPASSNLVAAGELNGDGNFDLIVTSTNNQPFGPLNGDFSINAVFGTGTTTFGATTNLKAAKTQTVFYSVAIDLKKDGIAEVVTTLPNDKQVWIFSQLVNTPTKLNLNTSNSVYPVGMDVNGDGRQDIVIAHIDYTRIFASIVSVFLQEGDQSFSGPHECGLNFRGPFVAAAIEESGQPGILAVAAEANRNITRFQFIIDKNAKTCMVKVVGTPLDTNYLARAVAYEDVDGDGKKDLIYLSSENTKSQLGVLITP